MVDISSGDTILFKPKNGGIFPTGEEHRKGYVESVRDEVIVRKNDGLVDKITNDQIVKVFSGGTD